MRNKPSSSNLPPHPPPPQSRPAQQSMGNYLSRSMGPPLSLYLSSCPICILPACMQLFFFAVSVFFLLSPPPPPLLKNLRPSPHHQPTLPLASHHRLRPSRLGSYRLLTGDSSAAPRPLTGVAFAGAEYVSRVAGLTSPPLRPSHPPSKYNDSRMFAQAESTPPPHLPTPHPPDSRDSSSGSSGGGDKDHLLNLRLLRCCSSQTSLRLQPTAPPPTSSSSRMSFNICWHVFARR